VLAGIEEQGQSVVVVGDGQLGCLEVQLPTANQFMELAFQSVLNLGVPRRGPVRFRPEIFDRI
jgi:hypothetical protein